MRDDLKSAIIAAVDRFTASGSREALHEFENWFVPRSITIEASGQAEAIDLCYSIDGILSEASSAEWDIDSLKRELSHAVRPFVAIYDTRYARGIDVGEREAVLRDNGSTGAETSFKRPPVSYPAHWERVSA